MDFPRIALFGALFFTLFMIWEAWQRDHLPPPAAPVSVTSPAPAHSSNPQLSTTAPSVGEPPATAPLLNRGQRVVVKTDVLRVEIDTVGGDVRQVALLDYPVSVQKPHDPVLLLNDASDQLFVAQTGLQPASNSEVAPNHQAVFVADKSNYTLGADQKTLTVDLHWQQDGLAVVKRFTFHRGEHLIDVSYTVQNGSAAPWTGHLYTRLQRTEPKAKKHATSAYVGGVVSTPQDKYQKVTFKEMEERNFKETATGGWAAMIEHYFLAAWIPPQDAQETYYSQDLDKHYILGFYGANETVAPGATGQFSAKLYAGPKLQETLAAIAPNLDLTVDYGVLTVIAKPLYWLLEMFHTLLRNWGFAIIALTVLVKGAFYKLSETSYKSMAQMRKLQPRLASLKEKYGDDRQKLNEAMMKMYREEKINPLAGCLPIVIQIPVFIALYWVLLESVQLRQADFIFWIHDLSVADPYFVMPVIMGVTMLIQQRLNPTPLDPIQAKVMMILPIVFTAFFAFFPAGLVLYWIVNNTLSIAQQWYITRHVIKA